MSARSMLEGVPGVRDWLVTDLSGRPLSLVDESAARLGWAATSAAAAHQLARAGALLSLGAPGTLTIKGAAALTAIAPGAGGLLLVSADPSRPGAALEQALHDWALQAPAEEPPAAVGAAQAQAPEGAAPEEEAVPLIPLEQSPAESWAQLRRALVRGQLAEAASRWRMIAEAWLDGAGSPASPPDEYEQAMQTLLEGAGIVLAGDGIGGGRHLRALATMARDQPSFQWLARLWTARAALRSGALIAATGHAQSALRLAAELDEAAVAVSQLCAAEVPTIDKQAPAAQLAGLGEALSTFARLEDAWGLSRAWLAQARIQATRGLDKESAWAAHRACAADPGWDEPVVFLARRALLRGELAEAEKLLSPLNSQDAARELSVLASIRSGTISAAKACEFLQERDAPPGNESMAAMQKLVESFPQFLQARESLGWALLKLGRYPDAHAILRGLLDQPLPAGDRASVVLGLGCIANALKRGKPETRMHAAVSAAGAGALEPAAGLPGGVARAPSPPPSPPGSAARAVFSGRLGVFALPDLLEFLRSGRRTGLLVCSSEGGMGALHFRDGSITSGAAPGVPTLGEFLQRAGQCDAATLDAATARRPTGVSDPLFGELLVREGKVSAEAVREAAAQQIRAAVRVLVDWRDGEFAFDRENEGDRLDPATSVALDPQGLLLELCREQDEATHAKSAKAS